MREAAGSSLDLAMLGNVPSKKRLRRKKMERQEERNAWPSRFFSDQDGNGNDGGKAEERDDGQPGEEDKRLEHVRLEGKRHGGGYNPHG